MSVGQIEDQIRRLEPADLADFTKWFGNFLADRVTTPASDWQESPEHVVELNSRLEEFEANPAIAKPFEPDYFDSLRRKLADERAKKASAR